MSPVIITTGGGVNANTKPSKRFVAALHQGRDRKHKKIQGNAKKESNMTRRGGSATTNPQKALLLLETENALQKRLD